MTIGSPVASAVSGPGLADTYAICLLSGDQAVVLPVVGSGALVLFQRAKIFLVAAVGMSDNQSRFIAKLVRNRRSIFRRATIRDCRKDRRRSSGRWIFHRRGS